MYITVFLIFSVISYQFQSGAQAVQNKWAGDGVYEYTLLNF